MQRCGVKGEKMKQFSLLLSLIFVLFWSVSSYATDTVMVTCFGPKTYEREKGKPFTETDYFTIRSLSGTGQLIIHNGGSDKKTRVSSAEIWFNDILRIDNTR